ncbi:chemotaxis protein methyltransferase CheR [Candidatus Magnetomoraceae bacterium gMMP-15]
MKFYSENFSLPQSVFILLRDFIQNEIGIFFQDSRQDFFADKLMPCLLTQGFDSFLDYYYFLKYDATSCEWNKLCDALTVNETFFWREMDQIHALVDILSPQFFKNKDTLRIWCAACSTGEEPLSIAMAMNEAGIFDKGRVEIIASDLSNEVIENAQKGIYTKRSFRNLPVYLKEKYFIKKNNAWRIIPDLHARIQWKTANILKEKETACLAASDIIFCRNVFIYFSEDIISNTIDLFFKYMPKTGYLFLGTSESLLKLTDNFELVEIGNAFVYSKRN